jgi:hypothetical protein
MIRELTYGFCCAMLSIVLYNYFVGIKLPADDNKRWQFVDFIHQYDGTPRGVIMRDTTADRTKLAIWEDLRDE